MSKYAEYVFKKYEMICKTCGASSRRGSLKCWVCGRKINIVKRKSNEKKVSVNGDKQK